MTTRMMAPFSKASEGENVEYICHFLTMESHSSFLLKSYNVLGKMELILWSFDSLSTSK